MKRTLQPPFVRAVVALVPAKAWDRRKNAEQILRLSLSFRWVFLAMTCLFAALILSHPGAARRHPVMTLAEVAEFVAITILWFVIARVQRKRLDKLRASS